MTLPVRSGFPCFFSLTARAASGLCACLCLAAALALSPSSAMAESVYWYGPGAPENSVELRNLLRANSLAPSGPSGNDVFVYGDVPGHVFGGYASADIEGSTATAIRNSVSITGGTVGGRVYGGYASAPNGTATATASHNSVSIMGGTVGGDVVGGFASVNYNTPTPTPTATATASHNSVSIMGGTVGGHVVGGWASGSGITATHNTVTLSGAPVVGGGLYGGYGGGDIDGDIFTGNRLRLWDYQGASTLRAVANFEFYDFILPAGMADGGVLLRANTIAFGNNSGENSTITGLNVKGGGRPLSAGDTVTLLAAGSMIGDIEYNAQEITDTSTPAIQGQKGVSLLYTFTLSRVGDNLYATVAQDPQVNPQTKALSEGRVAGLAFVNQGADLAAGQALAAARAATADTDSLVVFSAVQGGGSRYHSGSHVDVNGFSVLAGMGRSQATDYGTLLLGAFMEAGVGNYDSHNSFTSRPSVSGSGDTTYQGGGLLGRFDFNRQASGHAYAAASLRLGWSETDFSSSDLVDAMGQEARYTSGALYYGAHAALGYVWDLSREDSLDFSLAWLWTHQDDDKVSVVGDPVHFKAADSHRLRGGLRYAHDFAMEAGALLSPYVGAAYEHEFDGRARADVYGRSMDAPKLSGGTGMGEFGVVFKPGSAPGLSLDLGVQGYSGKREGVTGSLAFNYEF